MGKCKSARNQNGLKSFGVSAEHGEKEVKEVVKLSLIEEKNMGMQTSSSTLAVVTLISTFRVNNGFIS